MRGYFYNSNPTNSSKTFPSSGLPFLSAMGEEGESQLRTEMDSSSKRKLEEIQIAKQKAQEIVARLVNDAEAKRPRFDEPSETHVPDSHLPLGSDISQRPPSQPIANSQVGSFPFVAQPIHYNNFQGTSKKVDVPNAKVGVIIGKGGETIKYLQLQSGARIQVTRDADADPYSQTREVELTGTLDQVSRAEQLIKDVISESDTGGSSTSGVRGIASMQPGTEQFSMRVPNNKVAMIIGKGGETIKNMQNKSGARIQVVPLHLPPGDTSTERTVFINGSNEQIEYAKELVNEVISENRARNAPTSGNYMQQGYHPPGSWGQPGQPPALQAAYGYGQPGVYPTPPPYYGGYPPQPAGWDQAAASGSAPPPQQSAGYDYYGQQQGQVGSIPSNVDYGYSQTTLVAGYGYDQSYTDQQQNYGQDGPPEGQQHDPNNPYATPGYGSSGATPGKPEETTGQTVGTTTSQPYVTQSSKPAQPVTYSQQPTVSPAYVASQSYSVQQAPQPAYDQSGYTHTGYGGQQPAQSLSPTSQLGHEQGAYPPQPAVSQSGYVQGTNPPAYEQPEPQP